MIARSAKMRAFVAGLERVANSETTLLLEGETGTGKERAAKALHARSPRNRGPFVTFDCAAVPPSLAAAELFGVEKGAFAGADLTRHGLLEAADGGTLFIDEIGELPLEVQPLLLGALERKHSRRLGGKRDIAHDVRIVAATNRNLAEEVRAGRFRQDLFYRLAVAHLRIPSLRERREDMLPLIEELARADGLELSAESLAVLAAYRWPGNVRELKHTLTRMAAQAKSARDAILGSGTASASALIDNEGHPRPWLEARRLVTSDAEREYVQLLLAKTGGNLTQAAELAGISRQGLTKMAEKHGLH
jgi:DNA-binding NtrC family response regulator